ncbi:MAG: HD domain-containing protein [Myxococcota bacterium]|nr:HD domain-containing protein [Myxococcota bacterium]
MSPQLRLPDDHPGLAIARAVAGEGGCALVVGGWVRDRLLDIDEGSGDLDLEVFGLAPEALERVLARFGRLRRVGRAFPVYQLGNLALDVSAPGSTNFAEAAGRRDLRVNAIAWDPLTGALEDPHEGQADLASGTLRAVDPARFGEDPLRGLRTARLAARLEMRLDAELMSLCAATDLADVPAERLFTEWKRILLRTRRPSVALVLLRELGLLRFFPELAALVDVPQDPEWHPEGDVWVHTGRVVDQAAQFRRNHEEGRDLLLMFGALCHDFGKPGTTEERDGRIVSRGHSEEGLDPTRAFLERLRAPGWLVTGTVALVRHHLAPAQFVQEPGPAGAKAYRKLARRLAEAGIDFDLLYQVARADHLGTATPEALAGAFAAGDRFLERARAIDSEPATHEAAVTGRHLLALGVEPGPGMGALLARCLDIQDETGWTDPEPILARALTAPSG